MKKISWAFNEKNMPVLAVHARKEDGPFHCHCGKQHPVHLSKPSGDPDKRIFQAYFAHNNVLRCSLRFCKGGTCLGWKSANVGQ